MYLIQTASQLSGVSIRSLRHYDKLGLLSPSKAENGYRYYSDADLSRLQTILFYKYLGFSLKEIKVLLENSRADKLSLLENQLDLLKKEQKRLATLIDTLTKTIQESKGEITMTTSEKFVGFSYQDHENYKEQAIETYGKELIESAYAKQAGKEDQMTASFNQVFQQFAEHKNQALTAQSTENLALAEKLHQLIRTYAFDCSLEIFGKIGLGYVANPDFKNNIDQFGQDLAQYTCDAIQAYVNPK